MKNYSYVTLLSDDTYAYGVILLLESLKTVKSKYPLHVLVTDEVSAPTIEILKQLDLTYEIVDTIKTPNIILKHNYAINARFSGIWRNCFTKIKIFNLTQFEKIVFLDCDILILKNIDNLFNKPHMTAAIDGEYFNLYPNNPHFNAGCLVIQPNKEDFNNLMNLINTLNIDNYQNTIIADQELLNIYYNDWYNKKDLHLNKYYNIFGPYIEEEYLDDIKKKAYFIHFVGRKPWTFWVKIATETYSEYFYQESKSIIEKVLSKLDWAIIRKFTKITVYGICKNERDNIEAYLESFSKGDYICLLDTGSTDGTWEYLQKAQSQYPNLIIDQKIINPWRFDTARNESMKLIPKDTTLFFMADVDEVIKEDNWPDKIRNAWTPLFNRGRYTYNRDVDKNTDTVMRAIDEYRIHSKDWYKWKNIVHESLINYKEEKYFYIETCTPIDITVWHYPKDNKKTNYMELCEADLEESPDDWVMRLQLAIEYEIREQLDKAEYHFRYMLNNQNTLQNFENARCYFGIGRKYYLENNLEQAMRWFREGRLYCPIFADNYLAPAEILYNNKKYKEAYLLAKESLKNCESAFWCGKYDCDSYLPYWICGMSSYFLGNKIEALGYLSIAAEKNNSIDISNNIHAIINEIVTQRAIEGTL